MGLDGRRHGFFCVCVHMHAADILLRGNLIRQEDSVFGPCLRNFQVRSCIWEVSIDLGEN